MKRNNSNSTVAEKRLSIHPSAVREGDFIEAHFPNGEIERGVAIMEERPNYHSRYKRRMMLCEPGEKRGHVITGWAGFPAGTQFYRVTGDPDATVFPDAAASAEATDTPE